MYPERTDLQKSSPNKLEPLLFTGTLLQAVLRIRNILVRIRIRTYD
jgi:hypothetical protein